MPIRYCPECKQNVACLDCGYEFSIPVDKSDIGELVKALEKASHTLADVSSSAPIYGDPRHSISRDCAQACDAAEKFRKKYLDGK